MLLGFVEFGWGLQLKRVWKVYKFCRTFGFFLTCEIPGIRVYAFECL